MAKAVADALTALGKFEAPHWAVDGDPDEIPSTSYPQVPFPASRAEIRFPALAVSEGDSFYVASEIPTSATAKAVHSGYFRRLFFYDSTGSRWPVLTTRAAELGVMTRLTNRVVDVELFVGDAESACLPAVAEALCAIVDDDPDDLYSQVLTPEEVKERIRQARTALEQIELAKYLGA